MPNGSYVANEDRGGVDFLQYFDGKVRTALEVLAAVVELHETCLKRLIRLVDILDLIDLRDRIFECRPNEVARILPGRSYCHAQNTFMETTCSGEQSPFS